MSTEVERAKALIAQFLNGRHGIGIETAYADAEDLFAYVPNLCILADDQKLPLGVFPTVIEACAYQDGQRSLVLADWVRVEKC